MRATREDLFALALAADLAVLVAIAPPLLLVTLNFPLLGCASKFHRLSEPAVGSA